MKIRRGSLTVTDYTIVPVDEDYLNFNDDTVKHEPITPKCYILLGDWGKGGLAGDIMTTYSAKEKNGQSSQKVSYTYQAAIGRAINSFIKTSEYPVEGMIPLTVV